MSRRPDGGDNVLASTNAHSHLDPLENSIQFRVAVHAQTSEFLNQKFKDLSIRLVRQTDHAHPQNSPTGRTALPFAHCLWCIALSRRASLIPAGMIAALADDAAAVETARCRRANFRSKPADWEVYPR